VVFLMLFNHPQLLTGGMWSVNPEEHALLLSDMLISISSIQPGSQQLGSGA